MPNASSIALGRMNPNEATLFDLAVPPMKLGSHN